MPLRDHHAAEARKLTESSIDRSAATRPGAAATSLAGGEPEYVIWGSDEESAPKRQMLATLGAVELEYAALRSGIALVDTAYRAVIRCSGDDAIDLLNRLTTRKLEDLPVNGVRSTFLLERTGRILSDFNVVRTESNLLIDVDCSDVPAVMSEIDRLVFSEDIQLELDEDLYTIEMHGPEAHEVLAACSIEMPEVGSSIAGAVGAKPVRCVRGDLLGVPGLRIQASREDIPAIWETLHGRGKAVASKCRTAGWYAVNIARVEAASPWWHIDFGPTNLPHETGVLRSRVDFDKGCYTGQEIVARMEHLGNPKQILRRIVVSDERLPIAGGQILGGDDGALGNPIGVITSSAPSPMRGNQAVAMGMVKWSAASPGESVTLFADGEEVMGILEEIEETS
ncbi:MAG: aminomethyl transferase family protein [Planctomycetes bacterium]|jgi:folate-binding protein YgfZ|nr:aminomethyl transferase family protein [Planctomycetota bacterium]MCP4837936.1 aminomethyl transferase family protein [Planctomycetota bacterium]